MLSGVYGDISKTVQKFTQVVYSTIMNPSDHGHNCGLIFINYALISEIQNMPQKDREAFIDKYKKPFY